MLLEPLAAAAAGLVAGTMNAVVGSGTLVSFPVLLALGLDPVVANMTSSVGLLAGNLSAVPGYRAAIDQARGLPRLMAPASLAGGIVGALLLLVLPGSVFAAAAPVLVALALVLVAVGPRVQRAVARRLGDGDAHGSFVPRWLLLVLVFLTGVYGGYFGAAQGIILVGLLGVTTSIPLPVANGLKVVLAMLVNLVGSAVFVAVGAGRIDWPLAGWVALGAGIGGVLGARVGQRLPAPVLRATILAVGLVALGRMLLA